MNKRRRIGLIVVATTLLTGGLAASLIYAHNKYDSLICNMLDVKIYAIDSNIFITKDEVLALFQKHELIYFGAKVKELPIAAMENLLQKHTHIKTVNVYAGIDGVLHIDIVQRRPILRVYNKKYNFYMDGEGFVMHIDYRHPSYVPIVNGGISLPFSADFEGDMLQFLTDEKITDSTALLLLAFCKYIDAHPFWKNQIEQIYFTNNHNIELIPRVGAHIIRLGTLDNYSYKLAKLLTVYKKGFRIKNWNNYKIIDLSYSNQVVCKRI
ncbi:cell division protein FtsQ [Bacteroidia bacterium]|nr:cell division protein FtsQ [Bacteroidia bacterium]